MFFSAVVSSGQMVENIEEYDMTDLTEKPEITNNAHQTVNNNDAPEIIDEMHGTADGVATNDGDLSEIDLQMNRATEYGNDYVGPFDEETIGQSITEDGDDNDHVKELEIEVLDNPDAPEPLVKDELFNLETLNVSHDNDVTNESNTSDCQITSVYRVEDFWIDA